jgi:hypothetical protein
VQHSHAQEGAQEGPPHQLLGQNQVTKGAKGATFNP